MKTIEDKATRIILLLTTAVFILLATTERANAQFGLNGTPFDVQYNNQFDDSTQWLNLGYTLFEVDTTSPYGSFVSNYMGAINSFTAANGFAMIDLDAQPDPSFVQYGELALLETITLTGHDNYGIGFQSYYGAYDGADSVFVKVTNNNGTDTLIRLHADLPAGSIEDSTHYIDLSSFVQSGDEIAINFVCHSSWGLAWMLDDLVVLAWNPTVVISGIEDLPTFNGVREVTAIYNLLGQPVKQMESNQVYIKVYNDGTKEKVSVR
tara:strand:- start:54 stop:848 length:795 start_codon:yes stop_codon:yes gene_type:complete